MNRFGWEQRVGRVASTFPGLARGDGNLVPIIPKSEYKFIGQASSTQEIVLAAGVPSS